MKYPNINEAIAAIIKAGRATEEELNARIGYMQMCGFNEHACLAVLST